MRYYKLLIPALLSGFIGACGGGGGDTTPTANTTSISGTIAAGAPLSGFVALKDTNGTVKTAVIDDSGNYSIDTAGLTSPFVLFASGISGGRAYTIASVATTDDVNGTVNVTPLTDLIVGNIGGMDSVEFYNAGNFTAVTTTSIDTEKAELKVQLQPILDALNVDASFDLLTTAFTADRSGFDAVLDVLDVQVDTATDTATISYVLDNTISISDDLTANDTTEIAVPTNISADATVAAEIDQMITNFQALFPAYVDLASYVAPTSELITPFIDTTFMFSGLNQTGAIGAFSDSTDQNTVNITIGLRKSMESYSLTAINTSSLPYTANARFELFSSVWNMGLTNSTGNAADWKFTGDGYTYNASATSETHKAQNAGTIRTELHLGVGDSFSTVKFAPGEYMVVTGPGLPAAGVVIVQYDFNQVTNAAAAGTAEMMNSYNGANSSTSLQDSEIDLMPDGSVYTFTRMLDGGSDTNIYDTNYAGLDVSDAATLTGNGTDTVVDVQTQTLIRQPAKSNDTTTQFATITSPTVNELQTFNGSDGSMGVTWTLPAGSTSDCVSLDRTLISGLYVRSADDCAVESNATSVTLDVAAAADTVLNQAVYIFTNDAFNRTMATQQDVTILEPVGTTLTCDYQTSWNVSDMPESFISFTDFETLITNCGNEVAITDATAVIGTWIETELETDGSTSTYTNTFASDGTGGWTEENTVTGTGDTGTFSWSIQSGRLFMAGTDASAGYIDIAVMLNDGTFRVYSEDYGYGAGDLIADGTADGITFAVSMTKQ